MAQLQYAKKAYPKAEQYIKRFEKVTRHFSPVPLALSYKVYRKQGKNNIAKNYASMLVKMFPRSYQSQQYLHNGLAHIEADSLAEKYQQLLLSSQPVNVKKRVFKLSPNHQKKIVATTYKTPFKVKSELNRLPISRSIEPEKLIDKNESTKTDNENVISDEMMDALINETVVSTVSRNDGEDNSKANSQINNKNADKMIDTIVSADIATDIATNDTNDNVSKNSAEQQIDNIVNDDITNDTTSNIATNDNVSKNGTEQEIDNIVNDDIVSDVATNDSKNNVSKNGTEQEIDNIVNDDVTTDTTSDDATDKAIDEAINNLVTGDASYDTTTKNSDAEKSVLENSSEPLIHIIKKDQNLFYISRTYNIRLSALRRWNHLTKSSVLQVGDVIHLTDPVTVKDSNKVQP